MPSVALIIISSSCVLALLGLLFFIEDRRGRRFLERPRLFLDRRLQRLVLLWHASLLHVGGGAMRVWLHWVFHRVLGGLMWLLAKGNEYLARLQRRNRRVVKSVQAVRSETHLAAIDAHRQATALSPKEKEELKEKSLQG